MHIFNSFHPILAYLLGLLAFILTAGVVLSSLLLIDAMLRDRSIQVQQRRWREWERKMKGNARTR